jgi:transcriptional antiterminator RfaH
MTNLTSSFIHPDGQNWFAVQLRPNMRLIAERHLTRQGFTVFAPTRFETIRRRGRLKTEAKPLFPGYLFVRFDARASDWRVIASTRGVLRIVTEGRSRPSPIPQDFMTALLSRCDGNGLLLAPDELALGDTVQILTGPFAGLVSRIDHLDQQERLHLLIQVLGRQVRTVMQPGTVSKIEQPEPA